MTPPLTALSGGTSAPPWWVRPMTWLRPNRTPGAQPTGREAYQLRFLSGAVLLGTAVALLALAVAVSNQQWLGVGILLAFLGAILVQVLAARLGAPIAVIVWTMLATVGALLLVSAMVPGHNQAGQLYWFLLLPLVARALTVPRHDDTGAAPSRRAELIVALLAFGGAAAIMLGQSTLMNPASSRSAAAAFSISVDVGLFLASALGLLYIHDLSVRENAAELRRLRQLLAVCAWCRRIQDGEEWVAVEQYMDRRQQVDLTHGMCPSCYAQQLVAVDASDSPRTAPPVR